MDPLSNGGAGKPTNLVDVIRANLREPLLVPEIQQVSTLFESMRKNRVHLAIVMDEYGSFSGVVTMEDMLEEIVGEISDELDVDEPSNLAHWKGDYWEADASISVTDLSRIIGVEFPVSPDANTVNGLFMKILNRMPKQADEIEFNDFRFVAIEEDGNRIGLVHIFPLTQSEVDIDSVKNTH